MYSKDPAYIRDVPKEMHPQKFIKTYRLWESQLVFTTVVDFGNGNVSVLLESSVLSNKLSGNKNKRQSKPQNEQQDKRIRGVAGKS